MGDGHARASGLLDDQSGPGQALLSDPLSAVLRAVSLTGTCFFVVEAVGPWWAEVPSAAAIGPCILPGAQQLVSYHVVTEGRCWAGLEHGGSLWADPGDIVVIPHGDCYALANAPGVVGKQSLDVSTTFFRQLAAGLLPPTIRYGDPGPPDVRVLCGFLGCDLLPFNPILGLLPALARVPAASGPGSRRLAGLVELALSESRERSAGSDVVLLRISELLFVEVIRRHVEALPPNETSWLAGLRDPVVSRALALLHGDPARAWSLPSLAREVAVSRSVLAERFTRLVGVAPIQYLTRWRMQLASRGLREGRPVARVGLDVGYESEAAFSRAFKNVVGTSPAAWRRCRMANPRRE
jgi:AraC-like DNA-binding protein